MNIRERIKKHEGWRSRVYYDTEGVATIGWGFNLEHRDLPKPVAKLWLDILIDEAREDLQGFDWYNELPENVQDAILDMRFNLGPNRFRQFKRMIAAFEKGDRDEAAKEMLDSKWAKQVGHRATELASIVAEDFDLGI